MATFAISSLPCKYPDDLAPLASSTAFSAIEWDLNFIPLPLSGDRRKSLAESFRAASIAVRYHLPYSTIDIGNMNDHTRHVAETYLAFIIDLLAEGGPFHAVIHFGASGNANNNYNPDALTRLIDRAKLKGGAIAIENLLTGPTTNPQVLRDLALGCGCGVALDVGHARTTRRLDEYLATVGDLITHVHFYDIEDERRNHLPFRNATAARETALLVHEASHPDWWTFEMDSREACVESRDMLIPLGLGDQ